jgi:hypothetical protein
VFADRPGRLPPGDRHDHGRRRLAPPAATERQPGPVRGEGEGRRRSLLAGHPDQLAAELEPGVADLDDARIQSGRREQVARRVPGDLGGALLDGDDVERPATAGQGRPQGESDPPVPAGGQ